MRLSDEQLMAYADGEVTADQADVGVRMREGLSVEEQSALEDFRRTRELVRAAFAEEATEPPSAALVALLLEGPPSSQGTQPKVVPLQAQGRRAPQRSVSRLAFAAAASIATLVAAAVLWSLTKGRGDIAGQLVPGPLARESEFARVLETRPSGDPVATDEASSAGRQHLMVAGTFRDRSGRVCRELELLDAELSPRVVAVACRSARGDWGVEGAVAVASGAVGDPTTYAPAGTPEQEALGALMSLLGASRTLEPEEERRLIGSGWK